MSYYDRLSKCRPKPSNLKRKFMEFFIVDVFAEKKYQGNQLTVFIPKNKLSDFEMQQIAKEMNFSETSFILSADDSNGYDVRIFTPDVEIPFAGHPTLGTAFIIHKIFNPNKSDPIILNLNIGKIPVTVNNIIENEFWMDQKNPDFGMMIPSQTISDILQINKENISLDFPIQLVSTGLPAIIIPLKTLEAVKKCRIHHENFQKFIDETAKASLLVFCPEAEHAENDLHVRVFVDDPGFLEDAATGSANGNLAAYLLEHNFFKNSNINLKIEQGHAIKRPSLIKMNAVKNHGVFQIRIGGKVFLIAQGNWTQ